MIGLPLFDFDSVPSAMVLAGGFGISGGGVYDLPAERFIASVAIFLALAFCAITSGENNFKACDEISFELYFS
jgi:hypothetical protein